MLRGAKPQRPWDQSGLRDLPTRARFLIGVSGGRDSVALLHWLLESGYRKLIVCHLDHRLRGRSSTADARFVERLARAHGLECDIARTDVRQIAADTKQSIETAARAARYSFFAEASHRARCRTILLGHHADDAVETFLINLFRGAGTLGQRSIPGVSQRVVGRIKLKIIRPLLGVSRAEIDAYIAAHHLRFREDATNATLEPLRNRVRHRIIPMLEQEFGRDIRKTVRRAAAIAHDEDLLLGKMVPPTPLRLRTGPIRGLSRALQRRAIAQWLHAHQVREVSFDLIAQIGAMLDTARGPAKINLPGDRHVRRRAGELFVE